MCIRDRYQPVYRPNRHDAKDKQFSAFYGNKKLTGKSTATGGAEEINEMLDMIFQNNETALFIVRKLFTFFGYYEITPETESNLIIPLAEVFRSTGYELCLLYTSDAADERSSVDLGGRRIIKKKNTKTKIKKTNITEKK